MGSEMCIRDRRPLARGKRDILGGVEVRAGITLMRPNGHGQVFIEALEAQRSNTVVVTHPLKPTAACRRAFGGVQGRVVFASQGLLGLER